MAAKKTRPVTAPAAMQADRTARAQRTLQQVIDRKDAARGKAAESKQVVQAGLRRQRLAAAPQRTVSV